MILYEIIGALVVMGLIFLGVRWLVERYDRYRADRIEVEQAGADLDRIIKKAGKKKDDA